MEKVGITGNNVIEDEYRQNDGYNKFLEALHNHFNSLANRDNAQLFTTNAEGLFDIFLNNLPEEARQHYTCITCRHFVERFGNLVFVDENGDIEPAIWGEVPPFFTQSVEAIRKRILKSKVTGVFVSDVSVLGQPITGVWEHMSVELPNIMVSKSQLKTSSQLMAEKSEDLKILISALKKYPLDAIEQAIVLLRTESLYRSEKCLGVAEWFKEIQVVFSNTTNSDKRNNIVWFTVANAPTGFCHVNSSMIGTLLDDIVEGLPFETVSRKFATKMNPLQYQRPQVAPTVGNIQQAEKIIEKLGLEKSLHRRFGRLDELQIIWKPEVKVEKKENIFGVFSHLVPKENKRVKQVNVPEITMTWEKFYKTIIPSAKEIQFLVPFGKTSYSAILTAQYDDAPPIIQWDTEENRNPFSSYVYVNGSMYSNWNISTGYCKVTGICFQPSMWYGNFAHQGKSVFFILENAKDISYKYGGSGNALFPENLKAELREIRSTIEAYSKKETIYGYDEASACGIVLHSGGNWDATFKVTTDIGTVVYKLDRWD